MEDVDNVEETDEESGGVEEEVEEVNLAEGDDSIVVLDDEEESEPGAVCPIKVRVSCTLGFFCRDKV